MIGVPNRKDEAADIPKSELAVTGEPDATDEEADVPIKADVDIVTAKSEGKDVVVP